MHGPDEDDVVEQGGPPLRLPEWARRPRWLPGLGGRLSRGAALFALATLIVGLAAGYALGDRHSAQSSRPAPPSASTPAAPPAAAVSFQAGAPRRRRPVRPGPDRRTAEPTPRSWRGSLISAWSPTPRA